MELKIRAFQIAYPVEKQRIPFGGLKLVSRSVASAAAASRKTTNPLRGTETTFHDRLLDYHIGSVEKQRIPFGGLKHVLNNLLALPFVRRKTTNPLRGTET